MFVFNESDNEEGNMKKGKYIFNLIGTALLCVAIITVVGCGDDDDGGGLPYSGLTTPAEITAANSTEIAMDTIDAATGAADLGEMNPMGKTVLSSDGGSNPSWLVGLASLVKDRFIENNASSASEKLSVGASESWTETGSCDGTMTISISESETSGSGSMTAANYCEGGVTMNGTITFSMTATLDANGQPTSVDMTMNFSSFNTKGEGEDVTINGSVVMVMDASMMDGTMTFNIAATNNLVADDSVKMENYVMSMTGNSVSVSGKIFLSKFGYVVVSTPTAVVLVNDEPSSGVIVLTGANNASITVTFYSSVYKIEADLDGDGITDGAAACFFSSTDGSTSCPT